MFWGENKLLLKRFSISLTQKAYLRKSVTTNETCLDLMCTQEETRILIELLGISSSITRTHSWMFIKTIKLG